MLLTAIDLESTGLDFEKDEIIEVGAVLWDTETNSPVKLISEIVSTNVPVSDEITKITGITQTQVNLFGNDPVKVFAQLIKYIGMSEYVVAHNGNAFDHPMLKANVEKRGGLLPEATWIDTMTDIPYGPEVKSRALNYVASDHGFVNPFKHRAVFDVLTMLKVLSCYDIDEVIAFMRSPAITVTALTKKPWTDEGKSNNIAKSLGFRWNGEEKQWQQKVKEVALEKLKQSAEQMGLPLHVSSQ